MDRPLCAVDLRASGEDDRDEVARLVGAVLLARLDSAWEDDVYEKSPGSR